MAMLNNQMVGDYTVYTHYFLALPQFVVHFCDHPQVIPRSPQLPCIFRRSRKRCLLHPILSGSLVSWINLYYILIYPYYTILYPYFITRAKLRLGTNVLWSKVQKLQCLGFRHSDDFWAGPDTFRYLHYGRLYYPSTNSHNMLFVFICYIYIFVFKYTLSTILIYTVCSYKYMCVFWCNTLCYIVHSR